MPATSPLAKYTVQTALMSALYLPSEKARTKALDSIIEDNNRLNKSYGSSFFYAGKSYPGGRSYPRSPYPLHPSLREKVDALLAEGNYLDTQEKPLVLGFITHVLNASNCWKDYLRLLPDALHPVIQERRFAFSQDTPQLQQDRIDEILTKHAKGAQLLKNRLVWNLLS